MGMRMPIFFEEIRTKRQKKTIREREERTKRRYKDCCWSNSHSSELVHIPEKRRREKSGEEYGEEKDSFIPMFLTVFGFGC